MRVKPSLTDVTSLGHFILWMLLALWLAVSRAKEICEGTIDSPGTYELVGYTCTVTVTDGGSGAKIVFRHASDFNLVGENEQSPVSVTVEIDDDYYQCDYGFTVHFENVNVDFTGNGVVRMKWSSARFENSKLTSRNEMDVELVAGELAADGCVFADYASFAAAFGASGPLQKGKGIWSAVDGLTLSAPLPDKPGKITFTPTNFVVAFDQEEELVVEENKELILKLTGASDMTFEAANLDERHIIEGGVFLTVKKAKVTCGESFKDVALVEKGITIEAGVLSVPYDHVPTEIFTISEDCVVIYEGKSLICLYETSESDCTSLGYEKVKYTENMAVASGAYVGYIIGSSALQPKLTYSDGSAKDVEFGSSKFTLSITTASPDGIILTSDGELELVASGDLVLKRLVSPAQDKITVTKQVGLTVTEEIALHHATYLTYISESSPWKPFQMNENIKATFHLRMSDASFDVKEREIQVGTTVFQSSQFNFDTLKFVTVTTIYGLTLQCTGPNVASGFTIQVRGAFETLTLENEWKLIKPTAEKTIKIQWSGGSGKLKHPLENLNDLFTVTGDGVTITKIDTSSSMYQFCLYSSSASKCPLVFDQAVLVSDGKVDQVPEFTSIVYHVTDGLTRLNFKIDSSSSSNVSIRCDDSSSADIVVEFSTESMSVFELVNVKTLSVTGSAVDVDMLLLGDSDLHSGGQLLTAISLGTTWKKYDQIVKQLNYKYEDLVLSGYEDSGVMHPNEDEASKINFGQGTITFSGKSEKSFSLNGRLSVTTYSKATTISADSGITEINQLNIDIATGTSNLPHEITIEDALGSVEVKGNSKMIISANNPDVYIAVSHPFLSFQDSICSWKPWKPAYEGHLKETSRTSKILYVYKNTPKQDDPEIENIQLIDNSFTVPSNARHYNLTFEEEIADPIAKFTSNSCAYVTLKNISITVVFNLDNIPQGVSFRFEDCQVRLAGSDATIKAESMYFHNVELSLAEQRTYRLEVSKEAEIHMDVYAKMKESIFTGGIFVHDLHLYNSEEQFIKGISFFRDGWKFVLEGSEFTLKQTEADNVNLDLYRPDTGGSLVHEVTVTAMESVLYGNIVIAIANAHLCLVFDDSWKTVTGWANSKAPTFVESAGKAKVLYEHNTDVPGLLGSPSTVEFYDKKQHNYCVYDADKFVYLAACWQRNDSYPHPISEHWEITEDGVYVVYTSKQPKFGTNQELTVTLVSDSPNFDFNFNLANLNENINLVLVNGGSGVRKASFPETTTIKSLTMSQGNIDIVLPHPYSAKFTTTENVELSYRNFKTHFGGYGQFSQWFNIQVGGTLSIIDDNHFQEIKCVTTGWEVQGGANQWSVSIPVKQVHGFGLETSVISLSLSASGSQLPGYTSCSLLSASGFLYIDDSFKSVVVSGNKVKIVSHSPNTVISMPWASLPMTIFSVEGEFKVESRAPTDEKVFCVQGDSSCGIQGAEVITTSEIECHGSGRAVYYVTKEDVSFKVTDQSSTIVSIIGVGSQRRINLAVQNAEYVTNLVLTKVNAKLNTNIIVQSFEASDSTLMWGRGQMKFSTGRFSSDYGSISNFAGEISVLGALVLNLGNGVMTGSTITTFTFESSDVTASITVPEQLPSITIGHKALHCAGNNHGGIYVKNIGFGKQELIYQSRAMVMVDYDSSAAHSLSETATQTIPHVAFIFNENSDITFLKQLPSSDMCPLLSSTGKNITLAVQAPNDFDFAESTTIISDFTSLTNLADLSKLSQATLYVDTKDTLDEVQLGNDGMTLVSSGNTLDINNHIIGGPVTILNTRLDRGVHVSIKDGTTKINARFHVGEGSTLALGKGFTALEADSIMIITGDFGSHVTWEEPLPSWVVIGDNINKSKGLSSGAIAGIVVAVLAVLAVAIFLGVWFGVIKKRQRDGYDWNDSVDSPLETNTL